MALVKFIRKLFSKRDKHPSLFSQALSEGFEETFKEMGYQMPGKHIGRK
jgi:hypothetical protein